MIVTTLTAILALGLGLLPVSISALGQYFKAKHSASLHRNSGSPTVRHQLLDAELRRYERNSQPISTLTWFRGDFKAAIPALEGKLQSILEQNRWLGGSIEKSGNKLFLVNDPSRNIDHRDFLVKLNPSNSPVSRDTPLSELGQKTKFISLAENGKHESLLKVAILPCRKHPTKHFAVVFSLSHIVADGHTFYMLHNMLCSKDDGNIKPLIPGRIQETSDKQRDSMGRANYNYVSNLNAGWILNLIVRLGVGKLSGRHSSFQFASLDTKQIDGLKETAAQQDGVPFVSTNDVVTSWLMQRSGCSFGAMYVNFRNRLAGHTDFHAGNYESMIPYYPKDLASPGLVRRSLHSFRRVETPHSPLPTAWKSLFSTLVVFSNWASFSEPNEIDGCHEELHLPLYVANNLLPFGWALAIIFRSGPQGLGVMVGGLDEKLDAVENSPFKKLHHVRT